jgi:hypothetical protein
VHLYNRGEVVKSYYFWKESDGTVKGYPRPVIIKDLLPNKKYLVIKISRSNKNNDPLIRVPIGCKEWNEMGLYDRSNDSFVDKRATQIINEQEIICLLGYCSVEMFSRL